MKRFVALLLVLVSFSLSLCSCKTTIDGYYFSLEDARNEDSLYQDADHLFSVDAGDYIIDFVVKDDVFAVAKIAQRKESQYTLKELIRFAFHATDTGSENPEYHWVPTSNFFIQVKWKISENPKDTPDFAFEHKGKSYGLYYAIGD